MSIAKLFTTREAFLVRVAEDAVDPRVQVGDYVWVDPNE